MAGTGFSRAAESEAWILEILQHVQPQDSDTAEDEKEDSTIRGTNKRRGGYAASSVTQHGEGSFNVKQARKKAEREVCRIFDGLMDSFK